MYAEKQHLRRPPPPQAEHQFGLSPETAAQPPFECDNWGELGKAVTGRATYASNAMIAELLTHQSVSPRMRLAFPLVEGIFLKLNTSSQQQFKGYVSGNLAVNMNQNRTESRTLLVANARYSNVNRFKASTVCRANSGNNTDIVINVCILCWLQLHESVIVVLLDTREGEEFVGYHKNGLATALTMGATDQN